MAGRSKKYPHAFFERGSWYHRSKCLQEDYSVSYGKVGGFKSDAEAETAYEKHIEEFNRNMKAKFIKQGENTTFRDYLIYWFQSIYSERVETTTRYIAAYVIYTFLLPSITEDIKLRLVSTEYLDDVLKHASKYCVSAGNNSRELLYIAF